MTNDHQKVQFVSHLVGDRFFTSPTLGKTIDQTEIKVHPLLKRDEIHRKRAKQMNRYAAYIRISSEEQVGNFSVNAQRRAIDAWVTAQDGKLVKVYIDEAQSGRTAERPEFQKLRRDAKQGKFDAIVVHRFDRFARNRTDALAIKSLLRHEYGIKVYSVSEPSEDSDGPIGALIEGIMESVADWYSRNLATETSKGKRERANQGLHNNRPPFGMDKTEGGVLYRNDDEMVGLELAFNLYATGQYSDRKIAHELNKRGYKSKTGKLFSTDTVRDMLQNRTYLGYIKYQPYACHSDGRRRYDGEIKWFEGKHEAVIDEKLFEKCQQIRAKKAKFSTYHPKFRHYLLRDLIFCAECLQNMPSGVTDDNFGKMRPQSQTKKDGAYLYYRCRARDFSRKCSQVSVRADVVEPQVVDILKNLKPPSNWRNLMVDAMGQLLGDQQLDERISEIKKVIERMDFRWDYGFITDQSAYLKERVKLQQEMEQLTPIPDDELERAADLLENFSAHWEAIAGDRKAQEALIHLIVARIWVRDEQMVAISLRPNYHITLGLDSEKPSERGEEGFIHGRERRDSNPRSPP